VKHAAVFAASSDDDGIEACRQVYWRPAAGVPRNVFFLGPPRN